MKMERAYTLACDDILSNKNYIRFCYMVLLAGLREA
ncbi:protein of unknown function [Pseudomonas sp. JV551A1]|uniref:Uncharacterized protein n=1 Tax=Pseudomonas inefficax TaxID=2078786 RepID=A0AAQ1PCU9_9PSED|nr:protein of unknown function [Pseudomonas sp. JV551A1]SPO63265.1 protein of unknown function [Pseudomonas inefficax]